MMELTWHLTRAKEALEVWYNKADDYLTLATKARKGWLFSTEKECKQQALKCKTLGLVFHDRYKLVLER